MSHSIVKLSEMIVEKKIGKFRIETNPYRTKFGCTVDYNPTYYGSTIEQACSKAVAAVQKKEHEKLLKETGTENLFVK